MNGLKRKAEWQQLLLSVIESMKAQPFKWGQQDCIIFCAKCIDAMCGSAIAEDVIGKYESELGCKRYMLRQFGKADIRAAIDAYLPERKPIAFASRGDVVVFQGPYGLTAGIMWSTGVWCAGVDGVILLESKDVKLVETWGV